MPTSDVEELLAERGLDISYETVRLWVLKFGPVLARRLAQEGLTGSAALSARLPRSTAARSEAANMSRRYVFSTSAKPSFTTCRAY
jgi:hypothetical protein